MTSGMHRFIAVFLSTLCCFSDVDANYNKYVSLITDIRNEYKASSALFIFPEKELRMQDWTMAHTLTRTLSKADVLTLITNFKDLSARLEFYRTRIARPLVMILIKTPNDISEFRAGTREIPKTFPIWLVIFHGRSGDAICEYCRRPLGNMFDLRFDTLTMVVCCDDGRLQEWWSVLGNRTEISNIGTWTKNERLNLSITKESIARRHDFQGKKLRVTFGRIRESADLRSYYEMAFHRRLVNTLREISNFEIHELFYIIPPGPFKLFTTRLRRLNDYISRTKVDFFALYSGMADLVNTTCGHTHSFQMRRSKLYIKVPVAMGTNWLAYFKVLEWKIWLIIIALIVTTPFLLMIMKLRYSVRLSGSLYVENFLCVWGIFCQQGHPAFPTQTPMRIAIISIFISGVLVYVAYSATLISFLTVNTAKLPFSDLAGFIEDGSYQVITVLDSIHHQVMEASSIPIYVSMRKLMKPTNRLPKTFDDAWKQVCNEKVAFFGAPLDPRDKCKMVTIETTHLTSMAMPMPHGNQYAANINYHIDRLRENGVYRRLHEKYFEPRREIDIADDVVNSSDVEIIFVILACGIILSLFVFLCEMIYHYHEYLRRWVLLVAYSREIKIRWWFYSRKRMHRWTKNRRLPHTSSVNSSAY